MPISLGRADDWFRWALSGLVAGLVAYGSVGSRLSSLETQVNLETQRANEDRTDMRSAIQVLTNQVNSLTLELRQEEDRHTAMPGRRFDK